MTPEHRRHDAGARVGLTRLLRRGVRGRCYAAFNYPGVVAHLGAIDTATGAVRRLADIKGPTVYTVTSLARDPDSGVLYYTTDNGAWRDLNAFDPSTHRGTLLQKDARIGDLAFDRADKSIWGIRQLNGLCTLVRIEPPYTGWKQVHTFPYGTVVYDLDVSPDGTRLVASFGEISGKQNVRILPVAGVLAGDLTPVAQFDFDTSVPNGFVFSPDGRFVYGSSYYTGRVEHLSVRHRCEEARRGDEHRHRVLPANPPRRRRPHRVSVHRPGVRAGTRLRTAARGRECHHLHGRARRRGTPRAQAVERRVSLEDRLRRADEVGRASTISPADCAASRSIRSCRDTRTRRRSASG